MEYRKDIQVYRGIAVTLVVLFHLFPSYVPNGYLGVDIFFVISGFLMATLFHTSNEERDGKTFLVKRFKRIYPAYIGTLLIFLLYSVFVFSPYDFYKVFLQSLSGIFLIPNFYFWRTDSYFDAINFQPLLHYWSLGVEMQFYLLVPFLTLLFAKSRVWIVVLFLLSFSTCAILLKISPEASFFLVPFRIWEFMFGYFAVHFICKKVNVNSFVYLLSLFSLLFLLFSSFDFHPHPGLGAILVCAFTTLLIKFPPNHDFFKFRLFGVFERIGTYSYSLYLVHMPLIAIVWYEPLNKVVHNVAVDVKLGIYAVLCFIFTYISYNLFENSRFLSYRFDRKLVFYRLLLPSIFVVLVSGNHLNTFVKGVYAKNVSFAKEDTLPWRCGVLFKLDSFFSGNSSCLLKGSKTGSEQLLVVGDSHADSMKIAVVEAAIGSDTSVYFYKDNCVPGRRSCTLKNIIDEINEKKITKLVVHGLHYRVDYDKLVALSEKLSKSVSLFFIKPVPVFPLDQEIPKYLYALGSTQENVYLSNAGEIEEKYKKYSKKFDMLENAGFYLLDTIDIYCNKKCLVQKSGFPLYFDNHHLTKTGALLMKDRISTEIISN